MGYPGARLCWMIFCIAMATRLQSAEPENYPASIVQAWTSAARKRGPFQAAGEMLRYNRIMGEVHVSSWTARAGSPAKWRWDLTPAPAGEAPSTLRSGNDDYQVRPGQMFRLTVFNDEYHEQGRDGDTRRSLMKEPETERISFFPGLLPTPDQMMSPWDWIAFPHRFPEKVAAHQITIDELPGGHPDAETGFLLTFYPQARSQQRSHRSVEIMFPAAASPPTAVRVLDSSGNSQLVLTISDIAPVKPGQIDLRAD